MRRMETERLKVYYPEHRAAEAGQVAARLEECLDELEDVIPRPTDFGLVPVFLTETEFNNAYVMFGGGTEAHIVLPTFFTTGIFGQMGFTPSVAAVGCHEMVHYVQFIQLHGFFGLLTRLIGPTISPQIGLDLWFLEGLATYYESQLVEGVGRFGSPLWESYFAAGIAGDRLDGGRLSAYDREVPYGAHYLVGSYFVAYLAETYGEERLWQLVDRQGRSFFFPFAVSLRFTMVYGKPLGSLIREFEQAMRQRYPERVRPPEQERERWVGRTAHLEPGPGGRWALFSQDVDQVATIEVFDSQDRRLLRRRLPDVLPGRTQVASGYAENLRFSPDGRFLYFLAYHLGSAELRTSLMRLDIERNRLDIVRDELRALTGDITPDGKGFVLAQADGDRVRVSLIDLTGGSIDEDLFSLPPGAYVGWLRLSPSGEQIALTLKENEHWTVALLSATDGTLQGGFGTGESHLPAFDPYYLSEERLLFLAAERSQGRQSVQIVEADLNTGETRQRSRVPYMALSPRPGADGSLRFFNREGWGWSLDRLPATTPPAAGELVRWQGAVPEDEPRSGAAIEGYGEREAPQLVVSDRPYSQLDGLFIPRLRVPFLWFDSHGFVASLDLSGRDELGFHNWALSLIWQFGIDRLSGAVSYVNTQLAPWYFGMQVGELWVEFLERVDPNDPENLDFLRHEQRDRFASLVAQRSFFDIPLALSLEGISTLRLDAEADPVERTMVGARAQTAYRAGRSTSYGGAQWLLGLSGAAGYYPSQLGSDFSLGDNRMQLELHTPLPLSRRHRLRFSARGRVLTGVPEGEALLRVGGLGAFSPFLTTAPLELEPVSDDIVPTGFVFTENLRGFEDQGLAVNQIAIVDVNYRYPIIVDRGAASVLVFFPSVFFHGINLEAFASAATIGDGNFHAAVGGSVDFSFNLWLIPLSLRYQVAQRLTDDERLVHMVGFGAGTEL